MKNKTTYIIYVMLILFLIVGFISGFITAMNYFDNKDGFIVKCNPYTSRELSREGCNATIKLNNNLTIELNSNFDEVIIQR